MSTPANHMSKYLLAGLIYRFFFLMLAPLILGHTLWQAVKFRDGQYLRERFGFIPRFRDESLWLHAASVGEVQALIPLLIQIQQHYPDKTLVVSTATPTGARAVKRFSDRLHHVYLPIDWNGAVRRFLKRLNPACAIIMETEIWPHLYRQCQRRGHPVTIINGRISQRTLGAPGWLRRLYDRALGQTRAVLARSETDAKAFIELGVDPRHIEVIGNIKFAAAPPAAEPVDLERPYVLAASTRNGEEKLIVDAWLQTPEQRGLLVIAPRHPQRLPKILAELYSLKLNIAVRSHGDAITDETQIYIADTLGELLSLIAGARWVFMGGSLVKKGGQNILEPAALGKALAFGPSMENFADEARLLLDNGAARQVADVEQLAVLMGEWMDDSEQLTTLGQKARSMLESRRNMAEHYFRALQEKGILP